MTRQSMLSAVLVRFDGAACQGSVVLATLGESGAVLTGRFVDYARSLPASNWMKKIGGLSAQPLPIDTLSRTAPHVPCLLAINGSLTDEEVRLARQLTGTLGHCTVVVEASAEIRPEWKSVIRLPNHRSRDAQWAWFMRVYLDAMLNRGLLELDADSVQACTTNRVCEIAVARADGEGRAMTGVERAIGFLAARHDLGACDAFLLLFHSGPDVRPKEIEWGVQACRNKLAGRIRMPYLLKVGHLPATRFAVSLIAGH